ncbi:MAG: hypothetical protein KGI51_01975 [Rhodospirillales bacterium]|nr:hypothetical protein [Rhodospirillales bacterium]
MPAPDPRLPVRFGPLASAGPHSALLIEGDAPAPVGAVVARFVPAGGFGAHPRGCACCTPRGPVALALGALFLARARDGAPFLEVLAVAASAVGEAAIRAALEDDVLTRARFRTDQ